MTKLVQVDGMNPFWVWHKVKTIALLEAAGLKRLIDGPASEAVRPDLLTPLDERLAASPVNRREVEDSGAIDTVAREQRTPIVARSPGSDQFEIVWPDGKVRAWVEGNDLADQVAKVLTLALRAGRLQ